MDWETSATTSGAAAGVDVIWELGNGEPDRRIKITVALRAGSTVAQLRMAIAEHSPADDGVPPSRLWYVSPGLVDYVMEDSQRVSRYVKRIAKMSGDWREGFHDGTSLHVRALGTVLAASAGCDQPSLLTHDAEDWCDTARQQPQAAANFEAMRSRQQRGGGKRCSLM